jgi:hypothetical protein
MLGSTGLCFFCFIVMYVLLVVTIFPSQTESVLRLLCQQSFAAVSLHFPVAVNVNSSLSRGSLSV